MDTLWFYGKKPRPTHCTFLTSPFYIKVTFPRNKVLSHSVATCDVIVTLVPDNSASKLEWVIVQMVAFGPKPVFRFLLCYLQSCMSRESLLSFLVHKLILVTELCNG